MTNTGQPPTVEERLSRLETLFTNVGEQVVAHNNTIDVLVANIQQLTDNVAAVTNRVDGLAVQAAADRAQAAADRVQAAADRQQAAIDRQEFRNQMELRQREIQQIWEYLRDRNGGSSPPA